ncbi:hypothetical protein TSAR_003650 [Trichomalopsis sarcophagae]|uniref:PDZ domain-containing protein n=1 Tax=Trichomalopsis sarcophagae TaxID=543379 RepID=A0A232EG92_9HYME|nr:hypothetical protein TSAR_003650 [Trichomalopsis sarcophagae]
MSASAEKLHQKQPRNRFSPRAGADDANQQPQLAFYCQLDHGSTTGLISDYSRIAHCFDIRPKEILFCTLNTHKIDMSELLGSQIGLDDFIFAHKKELTLADNGAGYLFVKRIKSNSIMDRLRAVVQVGDHIAKLNGLTLRLLLLDRAPGAAALEARHSLPATADGGRETLRFRADGLAIRIEYLQQNDCNAREQIEQINNTLESYMGISDNPDDCGKSLRTRSTAWTLPRRLTAPCSRIPSTFQRISFSKSGKLRLAREIIIEDIIIYTLIYLHTQTVEIL